MEGDALDGLETEVALLLGKLQLCLSRMDAESESPKYWRDTGNIFLSVADLLEKVNEAPNRR